MTRAPVPLLILIGVLPCAAARSEAPAQCQVRLVVHVTPDVPDVAASGFLSSLLTNPNYRLNVLGMTGDRDVTMELTGPGSTAACVQVINGMRRDARILSIDIQDGTG